MPDNPIGPFGGVNPREVWIIAIVLAGVLRYAAVKYFEAQRGLSLGRGGRRARVFNRSNRRQRPSRCRG